MQIVRLHIERIRNLQTVALSDLQPFNVFYGHNGAGKTAVLEAIYLLATGRSFRTYIPKHYIQYQAEQALVFAQSEQDKVGIQKMLSGEQHIKVNGDYIATQGQLAKLLPIQFIDPQSTEIIDQGAKPRRQLLDWLMFHVEPLFYPTWQHYVRVLKQRNSLLKKHKTTDIAQFEPWNVALAEYGETLDRLRKQVIEQWQVYFQDALQQLLPELNIELHYLCGFHHERGLLHDLTHYHRKELEKGYTEYGPHKADLQLKTQQGEASIVLSRGQKKLLIIALKMAQIAMLHDCNKETVVLLDDLTAELDLTAQQRLIKRLSQLNSQVFMTTLMHEPVKKHLDDLSISYRLFEVERGQIRVVA